MARYVNVEDLLSRLPDDLPYKASVKRVLVQAPTADVVPRAEVTKLAGAYYDKCDECRTKCEKATAREIFEEIETSLNLCKCYGNRGIYYEHDLEDDIAELKKKYTEENARATTEENVT